MSKVKKSWIFLREERALALRFASGYAGMRHFLTAFLLASNQLFTRLNQALSVRNMWAFHAQEAANSVLTFRETPVGDKTWNIDYHGHSIQAINRLSWFPPRTSEVLEIDGVKVIDTPGSLLRATATHFTRHVLDGTERTVEMRFATEKGAVKVGCEVLVDGCKIGGTKAIMYPDPEETKRTLAKGVLQYFFTYGLPRFGLPYATLMLLMLRPSTTASAVGTFALHTIVFGGLMSWFLWRSLLDSARVRERFEAGHGKN